jgi:UDP-N-acetylglucosamine 3-dehydrogenase
MVGTQHNKKILLIGLGGFGRNHLRAWCEMGMREALYVAELEPERLEECRIVGIAETRIAPDYCAFLDQVDVVDIVTPSTSHFELCKEALLRGKDVFVEKPMTMTSGEAQALADIVSERGPILQVGYYYRHHPVSQNLKQMIRAGTLGALRYLSGHFMGFKRARTDVGVTHTDGIHFLDLFNSLVGSPPERVYAETRDHFRRGMEDWSIVLLNYPDGTVAKVESGYIQPGRWHDKVVPNAMTTKEIFVCGSEATIEVDFETENFVMHRVRHEFQQTTWVPVRDLSQTINVGTASPLQMICAELREFLSCTDTRKRPNCDAIASGVVLAKLMEAIYESAKHGVPIPLQWAPAETTRFRG